MRTSRSNFTISASRTWSRSFKTYFSACFQNLHLPPPERAGRRRGRCVLGRWFPWYDKQCLWLRGDKHLPSCPLLTSHLPIQPSSIEFTFAHQQPLAHTQIFFFSSSSPPFGTGPKTFTLIFITWLLWHMSFQTSHISVIMQMRWNITPLQQMARDDNNGSTEEIQCPWLYRHGNNNLKYM